MASDVKTVSIKMLIEEKHLRCESKNRPPSFGLNFTKY